MLPTVAPAAFRLLQLSIFMGYGSLKQVIFKKFFIHTVIFSYMYGNFQASVLSGQFIRLHLFSVQIIMNGDFPGISLVFRFPW